MRLLGRLKVEGGDLELTDCSIESDDSVGQQEGGGGRRLNLSTGKRPLSIDGGRIRLTRSVLTGHASGAIIARAASLTLVETNFQRNRAQLGGAVRVSEGSTLHLQRCNLTNNVADASGGALQVRHGAHGPHHCPSALPGSSRATRMPLVPPLMVVQMPLVELLSLRLSDRKQRKRHAER
eukprot:7382237-Prymnesium_polylepis.1